MRQISESAMFYNSYTYIFTGFCQSAEAELGALRIHKRRRLYKKVAWIRYNIWQTSKMSSLLKYAN